MKEQIIYLDFIVSCCGSTAHYLNGKDLSTTETCCVGLIERLGNNCVALRELVPQLEKKRTLDFACGLILRSSMLDYLIVLNLYKIVVENEAAGKTDLETEGKVKDFCNICLADGFSQTISYIKAAKEFNIIDQAKSEAAFTNLVNRFEYFFEPFTSDGTNAPKVKFTKQLNARSLFEEIAKSHLLNDFAKVYDTYVFFSKYDHFGMLYFDVINQSYEEMMEGITNAIESLVACNSFLHFFIRAISIDTFLITQSETASSFFMDNISKSAKEKQESKQ